MLAGGRLEQVTEALKQLGMADSAQKALEYLNEVLKQCPKDLTVACCDRRGDATRRSFRALERILAETKTSLESPLLYRKYGVVSHSAVGDLFSGRIPDPTLAQQEKDGDEPQSSLFANSDPLSPNALFDLGKGSLGNKFLKEIKLDNQMSDWLRQRIENCWKETTMALNGANNFIEIYQRGRPFIQELESLLAPVFGVYLLKLQGCGDVLRQCFSLLTMLSWATAVLRVHYGGKKILFREIPVLASGMGLGGGRVDAVEVLTINDKPPANSARIILDQMSQNRFPSVGYLVRSLERVFGRKFSLRIVDWKFVIGDGEHPNDLFRPGDLVAPRRKHMGQISEYLTLAAVDSFFLLPAEDKKVWKEQGYFTTGELVYFPFGSPPIAHQISLTPEEQRCIFIRRIVTKWPRATQQAVLRVMTNTLVGHIVGLAKGKKFNCQPIASTQKTEEELFIFNSKTKKVLELIETNREFFGPNQTLELMGESRDGKRIWNLHFDRFLQALAEGKIVSAGFKPEQGGWIHCIFGTHPDRNPSMRVYLQGGIAKCFQCGEMAFFAPQSIPQDLKALVGDGWKNIWRTSQTRALVIPTEHHQIMSLAQEILQLNFFGSAGEKYLVEERKIDGDLAYSLGVGFGDIRLIPGLMEAGYSIEALKHYGFLDRQGRCSMVRRLTFPLALGGKLSNFYGRATWPCQRKDTHRKLSVERTKIPHGAFNMVALEEAAREVIVAEGVMDALSLIQSGHKPTLAVIGGNNVLLMELCAHSGKDVAIALDNDATGQKNTLREIDRLKRVGFAGRVRNFTYDFLQDHSEMAGCKDFNEWWVRFGYKIS